MLPRGSPIPPAIVPWTGGSLLATCDSVLAQAFAKVDGEFVAEPKAPFGSFSSLSGIGTPVHVKGDVHPSLRRRVLDPGAGATEPKRSWRKGLEDWACVASPAPVEAAHGDNDTSAGAL